MVKVYPPDRLAYNSSICGKGLTSVLADLLIALLKLPQILIDLSFLITIIGVAYIKSLVGTIIPLDCDLSRSNATLSHKASGSGLALRNCG